MPTKTADESRDLVLEVEQTRAEMRRAQAHANHRRNEARVLEAELSGRLVEHVLRKIEELRAGRFSEATDEWLGRLAWVAGDPVSPSTDVVLDWLLEARWDEFNEWAAERARIKGEDPNDPTLSPRSRKEIEADLAKLRKAIEAAEDKAAEATKAHEAAVAALRSERGGAMLTRPLRRGR